MADNIGGVSVSVSAVPDASEFVANANREDPTQRVGVLMYSMGAGVALAGGLTST